MTAKNRRKVSVSKLFQSVIHCGLIAAGAVSGRFRMAEIRFYVDLFGGQLLLGSSKQPVAIQSVQIMRILEGLTADGMAQIEKVKSHTYYRLLPNGYLYLLENLVATDHRLPIEDTLFINYFIDSYREVILKLSGDLTPAQAKRLEEITQPGSMIERQLAILDTIIAKLRHRQQDYLKILTFLSDTKSSRMTLAEKIERLPLGPSIPQTFNRSLREALLGLPEAIREREVTTGFHKRHQQFYKPYISSLIEERRVLAVCIGKEELIE